MGSFVRKSLLNRNAGGVICSATLSLNSSFEFIKDSIGATTPTINDKLYTTEYKSPFYYEDQVELFVYDNDLNINSYSFVETISKQIYEIAINHYNRILVLCTSYLQVININKIIKPFLKTMNRKIFSQTIGSNRNAIIKGYKNTPGSILIGTMSFWEGIDLPGDLLEILIIYKIPFDNPSDPILLTEINNYKKRGKNPFLDLQIPSAAVKFKQGFGRLIRSMNDKGMCILTDPRLLKTHYGKLILDTLPLRYNKYTNISEINNSTLLFKRNTI